MTSPFDRQIDIDPVTTDPSATTRPAPTPGTAVEDAQRWLAEHEAFGHAHLDAPRTYLVVRHLVDVVKFCDRTFTQLEEVWREKSRGKFTVGGGGTAESNWPAMLAKVFDAYWKLALVTPLGVPLPQPLGAQPLYSQYAQPSQAREYTISVSEEAPTPPLEPAPIRPSEQLLSLALTALEAVALVTHEQYHPPAPGGGSWRSCKSSPCVYAAGFLDALSAPDAPVTLSDAP